MFDKMTFFIDKAGLIACLGFVIASCACFMIKNAIELIILGGGLGKSYPRTKGILLLSISFCILTLALVIISANKPIAEVLTQQAKDSPVLQAYLG